jgi:hypothetical protein
MTSSGRALGAEDAAAAEDLYIDAAIYKNKGYLSGFSASFCEPAAQQEIADTQYAVLQKEPGTGYYIARDGLLAFIYDEQYYKSDAALGFNVYDYQRNIVASSNNYAMDVVTGENRYAIDLPSAWDMHDSDHYLLEVINDKGERWYLRFYNQLLCDPCE